MTVPTVSSEQAQINQEIVQVFAEHYKMVQTLESPLKIVRDQLQQEQLLRWLHVSMGLNSEAGEIEEHLKKVLFYGKPLDEVNLKEELGDLLWYIHLACDILDVDMTELLLLNKAKLAKRYKEAQWTQEQALNRDHNAERAAIEGGAASTGSVAGA